MLKIYSLSVSYGSIRVLWEISLEVENASIVALVGANGAGKTTLLKAIIGAVRPDSGQVEFDGKSIARWRPHDIVEAGIGYVPEGRRLFPDLTVEETLLLGAYIKRARANLQDSMKYVRSVFPTLAEKRTQFAGTLSGGEQQMLAIARALMSRPKLLVLDEPSLGLAPLVFKKVLEALKQINETGTSILLAEQNAFEALNLAKNGYVVENGRIGVSGSANTLLQDERVRAAYLGA